MEYFQDFLKIDKSADIPVYLQVANAIIHQIRSGRLRKGRKMPGSRSLADLLAINRMTIVAAYDELRAQGWIIQYPGKGSFVNDELPVLKPKPITDSDGALASSKEIPFAINKNLVRFNHYKAVKNGQLIIDDGFPDPPTSGAD